MSAEELRIHSGIESLGKLFAIVLALAIGEAFRQFVSDGGDTRKRAIHWERIGALVSFVVLVVPFFHGMARYFFDVYLTPPRPDHYGIFLLIDTLVFTVEAVIFFILARSLDPKDDRKFYKAVLVLLVVDIAWALVVALNDVSDVVWHWAWINAVIALILFVILRLRRTTEDLGRVVHVCMCLLVLRTILDYSILWKFYFPPEPSVVALGSSGDGTVSKPIIYIASPYTNGDVAMNTHFQCKVFDQMLSDGKVWPIAPLWSHFQHTLFPRPYSDWIAYDQALLPSYDGCLRLTATLPEIGYTQQESTGADAEAETFKQLGKPVFETLDDLYEWVDARKEKASG